MTEFMTLLLIGPILVALVPQRAQLPLVKLFGAICIGLGAFFLAKG